VVHVPGAFRPETLADVGGVHETDRRPPERRVGAAAVHAAFGETGRARAIARAAAYILLADRGAARSGVVPARWGVDSSRARCDAAGDAGVLRGDHFCLPD